MIVLDASAVVELLLNRPLAGAVRAEIDDPALTWHAPHLLDAEVTQVLRRQQLAGVLSDERAGSAIEALRDFDVARYDHGPLLDRVWQLRANLTAYDAMYVALAEGLRARLVTLDAKIARSPGHTAACVLIS